MDTTAFSLTYEWNGPAREPWCQPDEYVDADALWIAWAAFGATHDGSVDLVVGDHQLWFHLDHDVCDVFDELPDVLEGLAGGTPDKQELWFAEQGTELKLVIEPEGDDDVRLRIVPFGVGGRFDGFPDDLGTVDRGEFIAGWRSWRWTRWTTSRACSPNSPRTSAPARTAGG